MGSGVCKRRNNEEAIDVREENDLNRAEQNWGHLAHTLHRVFQLRRLWSELGRHLQRYSALREAGTNDKRRKGQAPTEASQITDKTVS